VAFDHAKSELAMLKHIMDTNPQHEGWLFVRKLTDSFAINGVDGEHVCLVFEPMREPLWLYRQRFVGSIIPSGIL